MQEPEHLCKLFIGGLDYRTTDDSLKAHFEQYGDIVDVIVMKDPQTKRSRGFGFVAFSQSYMVDEAQKNRPHVVDGRTVDTKRAVPRDEIGKADGAVKKLFVGGIKDATEDVLRETFSQFGEVVSISIPVERETQKARGFAFVEFADSDSADKAALMKELMVGDTRVDIKKARDKNEGGGRRGGGGWGGRGDYGNSGGNQGGYGYGGGYGGGQGGYGGGQGGYGGGGAGYDQQGGSQGWGGSGYDNSSGGGWGGSGSDFGNNYGQSYSGGPTRGQGSYYQNNRSAPYSGGSQGGYNMSSGGSSGGGGGGGGNSYGGSSGGGSGGGYSSGGRR